MIKLWIKQRIEERTSIDGAALIALGVIVLIAGPFAKTSGICGYCIRCMDYLEKRRLNFVNPYIRSCR